MRNKLFMLVTLVVCLAFLVSIGFAEQGKKALPEKTAANKEKLKESDKKEQPKPADKVPSEVSDKKEEPALGIMPPVPQLTPVQLAPGIQPAEVQQPEAQPAPAFWEKGTQIKWQVLSCGGTKGSSTSYQMGNTVTQTGVGYGSSASYQLKQGFWQKFGETFLRGDANGDGVINVTDVVYLINYKFLVPPGPPPKPWEAGDVDCNGTINITDVVYLINFLFLDPPGPPPGC
jgi:hypothetical protein